MMMTPQQIVLEYERTINQSLSEQVRGILMLGDEIVTRCEEVEG